MNKGEVYLVGAGPGDKGLLTLKGLELIKKADVVVYDRLVSNSIMELIPKKTQLINVGKNVGNHPVPQHEINQILLDLALEGKKVVRLKGGDPFVFGRGGEELELLAEYGVKFQVVPGITSSIAVPAYGGIPVTHRDFCSSLHIITGHARAGKDLDIDFDSLVKLNGTLIFMMSVSTVGQIAKGLIKANMPLDMPCAVLENGTYSNMRKFVSDLNHIEKTVIENNVKSPAVIIVGKVCSLSDEFDWFKTLPLANKKFVVTQPLSKNSKLDNELRLNGAETLVYPCIETEFIRPINPPLDEYNTLIFTSGEGVKSFFSWLKEIGKDSRCLYNKKIAVIGSQTGAELAKYGINADFIPSIYDGETLGKEMVSKGFVNNKDSILLLRAKIGSKELLDAFENAEIKYMDYPVYETSYIEYENFCNIEDYDYVTFTSKSCVDGFIKTQNRETFKGINALCIGRQTAEEAKKFGFNTFISKEATICSMVEEVINNGK